MKEGILEPLKKDELENINGGVAPFIAWLGYAAASAVVGYFVFEATDGVVKGFSSSKCSCQ